METAARAGYKPAQGLIGKVRMLRTLADPLPRAEVLELNDLMEFDDDDDSDELEDPSAMKQPDTETQWLLRAALEGSWITGPDFRDVDAALYKSEIDSAHARLGYRLESKGKSRSSDSAIYMAASDGD